jgi:putative hydrolase of the HAD superfamily
MILFDFGGTICVDDPEPDFINGTKKLMELADDTNGVTPEEVQDFADKLLKEIFFDRSQQLIQISEQSFNRFLYGYFGITFSKTPQEMERVFWDNAFKFKPAQGIKELFSFMNQSGIRKAILSNNAFEESTIRYELDKHFINTEFDFIISTTDYCFRKPSPLIFNYALRRAGLKKEEVWYAGDSKECDIVGAAASGIFPVWYKDAIEEINRYVPKSHCLEVSNWNVLIDILQKL